MTKSNFARRYGPWALVTGAAHGLGAAFCEALVERGVGVLALDRDAEGLSSRVEQLEGRGALVESIVLDLRSEELGQKLESAVAGREVGLLVNNAGLTYAGPFLDKSPEQLRDLQRVNCDATLIATHVLARPMRARGRGGVIMVSSLSSRLGGPLVGHYAATKAYGATLAESLHEELRAVGVDVMAVLAPLIETPGLRSTRPATLTSQVLAPAEVAELALEGLGRRARVVPGRTGRLFVSLERLAPRALLRRIVAANVWKMYPDRAP